MKLDLYKEHAAEYKAVKKPIFVNAAPAQYLAVDGQGEPGGECFEQCVGALYAMAFTIKMTLKAKGQDYAVSKLEALWYPPDGGADFETAPKSEWRWKLMIRTPDFVGKQDLREAVKALQRRGKNANAGQVTLEKLHEGECVQMLHVGPYEQLCETITAMLAFAEANQRRQHGLHHEVYLSDPRRVPPERLKTLLRQPVRKA